MSKLSKLSIAGFAALGAGLALAASVSTASAEDARGRCDGTIAVAATYGADAGDLDNYVFTPGTRDQIEVRLNAFGNLRWFCNGTTGLTTHRVDCGAAGGDARIEVRFRNDGGVRFACV
jgi:hypothetical protein